MKAFRFILCAIALSCGFSALAQEPAQEAPKVPVAVVFPEQVPYISIEAQEIIKNKLSAACARSGMGATDDFCQFILTSAISITDKYVNPGNPPKFFEKGDLTIYVVDVLGKKTFDSTTIPIQGVGNAEEQAHIKAFKALSPQNPNLTKFLAGANTKIVNYYEGQIDNIITQAQSLAKVYKYDEALFKLGLVPEACPSYSSKVVPAAADIYQKYIDDQANRNLAKAKAIWIAGQDASAAAEAAEYLAEIMPEAKCYPESVALSKEIAARVKADIQYYRDIEARDNAQQYDLAKKKISAWRDVGVAYGNHQKADVYYTAWPVRY